MRWSVSDQKPGQVSADVLVATFETPLKGKKLPLASILPEGGAAQVVRGSDALTWMGTRRAKAARALLACRAKGPAPEDRAGGPCGGMSAREQKVEARHEWLTLGAKIERACVQGQARKVALVLGADLEADAALVEGMLLRAYSCDEFRSETPPALRQLQLIAKKGQVRVVRARMKHVFARAKATNFCRSLADLPPNHGTPAQLCARVKAHCRESANGLKIRALGPTQIRNEGLNLVEAVGRGAASEARVLVMEHRAGEADELPTLVLVGKGVTIDAGGYNLKTGGGVHEMNYDKAGASAVIGAMVAIAETQAPLHVVAVCPLVENLIGPDALRPGEILSAYDGTTIYVENTDAEGRLILADMLAWVESYEPELVVDLATLTGACQIALGEPFAGLFCNDDRVRELLMQAGDASDDRLWPLPIHELHDRELAHPRADLKNVGAYAGGASAAAAFLRYFVSYPWAHVDMAGKGNFGYERDYVGAGATGFGTRLLLELAHALAERGGLDTE